jgi:hypothetical protein
MKKIPIIITVVLSILMSFSLAVAQSVNYTYLIPYSMDYPMIRGNLYSGNGSNMHSRNFGVIRMFSTDLNSDLENALTESYQWTMAWGSYGTLGKGEDVFTSRAGRFRSAHLGR